MKSRLQQLEIEIAFEKGAKIEVRNIFKEFGWQKASAPSWKWEEYDFRIAEEPRRVPFDGSDYKKLFGAMLRHKEHESIYYMVVAIDNEGISVVFREEILHYEYNQLDRFEIWSKITKEWQPCNKVA